MSDELPGPLTIQEEEYRFRALWQGWLAATGYNEGHLPAPAMSTLDDEEVAVQLRLCSP